MEFNPLHFMWIGYSCAVTFGGLNVLYGEYMPSILVRMYTFGKARKGINNHTSVIGYFEVPKQWFSHFYVFATLYFSYICIAVFSLYFTNSSTPSLVYLLNVLTSPNRQGNVNAESVILLSTLLLLQVYRRCYECFYISVYSDSKMNILHYIVGITFYFGVGLSLLHDAPGFESLLDRKVNYLSGQWFTVPHLVGTILFICAFFLQFETHKAFANLRKTGNKVTSASHHIPSSGFFEYVSCPHYFAEILMYVSGCIILQGKSYSWWLVCLWTVCNQILTGLMSHEWYKKTFKNYPVRRKAILPFLL